MSERNYSIDFFKYLASLCIIAIHTNLFYEYGLIPNIVSVQIIARFAVPFFAVCSGYFAVSGELDDFRLSAGAAKSFWKQWKKLLRIYFLWSVLYLFFSIPKWIATGWFSAWAFVDYAIGMVRTDSHYHLWYLLSLLYAWPLFFLCLRKLRKEAWLPLSIILYIVKAVDYAYKPFLPEAIRDVFLVFRLWEGLYNGVFLILPFLLLGAYLHFRPSSGKAGWGSVLLSLSALVIEVFCLYKLGQTQVSFIFRTHHASACLF